MIYVGRQFGDSEWSWRLTDNDTGKSIANGTGKTYNQALNNAMVAFNDSED